MDMYFFDIETTGLDKEKGAIIEVALFNPAQEKEFSSFVDPQMKIPQAASAVNKITDSMVSGAPLISSILESLKELVGDSGYLVAHNGDSFDKPWLFEAAKKHNIEIPEGWLWIDSLKWSRKYRKDLRSHKLGDLAQQFGVAPKEDSHRALTDCKTLHRVCQIFFGDLKPKEIYDLLNKKELMRFMPFGKHRGVPISRLPMSYASWIMREPDMNPELKEAVKYYFFS